MRPPMPGSIFSTRPTFMATGAASAWWAGSCRAARRRAWWWRPNAVAGWPRTLPTTTADALRAMGGKEPGKPRPSDGPAHPVALPAGRGVYETDAVFDALDEMVGDGILGAYGVSVETVAQGLRAIERPGVATVQVIFNAFRLKPLEKLLPACEKADVGVIVRVPLASGLLSGRYDEPRPSPPATTGPTTVRAKPSTSARPFRACPTRSECRPPAGWPSQPCPKAGRCQKWRCAGAPTPRGFRPSSPAPAAPSRLGPTPRWGPAPASPRAWRPRCRAALRRGSPQLRRRPLVRQRARLDARGQELHDQHGHGRRRRPGQNVHR